MIRDGFGPLLPIPPRSVGVKLVPHQEVLVGPAQWEVPMGAKDMTRCNESRELGWFLLCNRMINLR